jgi:hypothetical protein
MNSLTWLVIAALWIEAFIFDFGAQQFEAGYREVLALRRRILTSPAAAIDNFCTKRQDSTKGPLRCNLQLTWWQHEQESDPCSGSINGVDLQRAVAHERRYHILWRCDLHWLPESWKGKGSWHLPAMTVTLMR